MPSKKLFLLDAMALIYRAHFAFQKNPRITSTGLNTSAVFGFVNTMLEVIQKEKPTHIGVAFDLPGPTFRHVQYEAYKAQRQEQPEDITTAIPYVKKIVEAMNIPLLALKGYEADDVVGTIAKAASKFDFEVYMYTPDKDYGQLVEEHIYLYKPAFLGKDIEIMGPEAILKKWNIKRVDQVVDMLGLMGDAVDNIPGLPGVGEKTAQKLLEEFDSVENIIANADKLKGKLQENVVNFAEQAILSKKLALIDIHVPIAFEEDALLITPPDAAILGPLLDELEFRTLKRRLLGADAEPSPKEIKAKASGQLSLFGDPPPYPSKSLPNPEEETSYFEVNFEAKPKETVDSVVHFYHTVSGADERLDLIKYLMAQDQLVFDTETTSTDTFDAEIVGLSFAYLEKEAFYIPIPEELAEAQAILEEFRPVFESETIVKIGQNIKYDIMILKNYGIEVKGPIEDTMLAHYILEPDQRHGMDYMANTMLNYEPISITELIGKKGKNQGTMRDVEIPLISEYASEDADITLQLFNKISPLIKANNLTKLYYDVEMPMVRVLADMEYEGVRLDVDALGDLSKSLEKDILSSQTQIFEQAGMEFNIASPKQLGDVLFEKMQLDPKAKKTKTGQYQTGEDILSLLEAKHPIISSILDFRELQKLKSTYVDALPLMVNQKTQRIHTSFNQAVAATGRLSSNNPNLQNIPIRTVRGKEIRKAFIPKNEDFLILSADYSQIELRIMAAFSGDESMLHAYETGLDIHSNTASKVFKVPLDQVDSDMRRKAKMVNFGLIYGISAFGLSQRLNIPRAEAKDMIDAYWTEFPNVKTYMDKVIAEAKKTKYVETILGRKRNLPNIDSQNQTDRGFAERNAINAPIQGSAADMIKVAMVNIHQRLKAENMKSKMIITVHDELVFDAHLSEIEPLKELVTDLMVNAIPMKVKMEVGLGTGINWLEAH